MSAKPNVIHFHFHSRRTGVTRSVENILSKLQQSFDVFLFGYGIDGHKISFSRLLKIVLGKNKNIVHVHRNNEMMLALLLRLFGGKFKLIATRHSDTAPSGLTNWLLKQADTIVALIPTQKLPKPSVVIGHGIDTNFFLPSEKKKISGVTQSEIISVVGRVRKSKGQLIFLEAIVPLLITNQNWAATVVGRVDDKKFKAQLDELVQPVKNQVYFIDETRDIKSIYQASRAIVVPSFSEGFSLVPLEAMACGCIVAATAHVGIHSDAIQDNKNGFLFERGNAEQLKEILKTIMSASNIDMQEMARKTVVLDWSVDKQIERLTNLYLGKS